MRIFCLLAALAAFAPVTVAQTTLSSERPVTAESEDWYRYRAPLLFGGTVYLPSGPQVHFNRNEMVRVGHFGAIPVYTLTTVEPNSVLLVPLTGGVLQPYRRLDVETQVGMTGIRTIRPVSILDDWGDRADLPAAAIQSISAATPPPVWSPEPVPADRAPLDRPVGTAGVETRPVKPASGRLTTAQRPDGLNAIFITFENQRWFSSGPAVSLDPSSLIVVGRNDGMPVYAQRGTPQIIYVPVARAADSLLAPYRRAERPRSNR